jgi:hypothetical protein
MEYHNFDYYQVAGDRFHTPLPYDEENKTVYRLHVRVKVTEVTDNLLKLLRDGRFRFHLENVAPELWQKARANKEGPELSSVVSLAFTKQDKKFLPQIPTKIFPKLASLDFGENSVDGMTLRSFQNLGRLTILRRKASCSDINDEDLRRFAAITSLVELNLAGCKNITDAGLQNLASLQNLVTLSLDECRSITGPGLRPLESLQKLVKLNISKIEDAGQGLRYLKNLTNLKELICQEASISQENMIAFCYLSTDGELKQNTNLQRLRVLDLWNCSFDGNILQHMAGALSDFKGALTNLEHLNLGAAENITEDDLEYLPYLTKLNYLKLNSDLITDHNIEYVTALKELTYIDLESDNIRGRGLKKNQPRAKKT